MRCVKIFLVEDSNSSTRERRIDEIRRAAIPVFAAQGFRGTSMADIAAASGVARTALYRFFDDRADVFRAAFDAVLNDSADLALAALDVDGTLPERLDGYLQRAHGDAYEALATAQFGAELMEARHEFAADIATEALARTHRGLRDFLDTMSTGASNATVIELLTLSPAGLKGDAPTIADYRNRLAALALAASSLVETGTSSSET